MPTGLIVSGELMFAPPITRRYKVDRNFWENITMNKITTVAFASLSALALAACGSSDDASVEAEADTVEMPANDAMESVVEEPAADPEANAVEAAVAGPAESVEAEADAAGDAAAVAAAEIQAMANSAAKKATAEKPAVPN
jgi:hypothetical protein